MNFNTLQRFKRFIIIIIFFLIFSFTIEKKKTDSLSIIIQSISIACSARISQRIKVLNKKKRFIITSLELNFCLLVALLILIICTQLFIYFSIFEIVRMFRRSKKEEKSVSR